jgi:hypothetical protein
MVSLHFALVNSSIVLGCPSLGFVPERIGDFDLFPMFVYQSDSSSRHLYSDARGRRYLNKG